ncbi:MAG TPA: MFS transporter, partial [Gammaproteobacteria bacterium]|nr:MFS transporter [Gammaproteobacteria bacterium]
MSHALPHKTSRYSILVISLCALFLFYKYVLQIYPSTITEQLMLEFNLSGAGLGNLAATFYYSYIITQFFVGVILDKYSTRWLTSLAIFLCALGTFWFSQTDSLSSAQLARALMGIGVAFATVAYMKVAATWFAPQQYAFISGLLATAAMAGAVFGQAPLSYAIKHFGWRDSLLSVGIAGFILAFFFLIFVRDKPHSTHHEHHVTFKEIVAVFKNKQNWLLTFYCGLAFTPIAVFGGLWGNPFLQSAYHVSKTEAATLVSIVFIGLGLGSPLLGIISDRLGDRRHIMFYCTLISCIAISLVLYWHTMPTWVLIGLLFIFGFALGAFMIVFAIGKETNNPALTATVLAMINASDGILT